MGCRIEGYFDELDAAVGILLLDLPGVLDGAEFGRWKLHERCVKARMRGAMTTMDIDKLVDTLGRPEPELMASAPEQASSAVPSRKVQRLMFATDKEADECILALRNVDGDFRAALGDLSNGILKNMKQVLGGGASFADSLAAVSKAVAPKKQKEHKIEKD